MIDHHKTLILAIDDEKGFRESLRNYLEDIDYQVEDAENGAIGLELFKQYSPDLVLLDLRMPEMDGLEVLKYIAVQSPDTPVIVLSGAGVMVDVVEALRLGAWDYLFKPLQDATILEHAVEKSLERAKLIKENRCYQDELETLVIRRTEDLERTATALKQSEEKYRLLTENLKDVVLDISPDGILINVSLGIREFGGYEPLEEIGNPISKYFLNKNELPQTTRLMKKLADGEKASPVEFMFKPKTSPPFPVEVTGRAFKKDGKLVSFLCSMRDITERKQDEEEKERLQQQLQQAQKMEAIGTLSGGIAHDFNNLLTVINGHAEIGLMKLDRIELNPQMQKIKNDFEAVLQAGRRAEKLTRQLLTFSRKQVYDPKVIQINDVINNLKEMLLRLIGEDISMQTYLAENIPPIKADPGQIEQIIFNLVINARDSINEGRDKTSQKQITIETDRQMVDDRILQAHPDLEKGIHVAITVSDSGVGMDSETQEKIFEPFFTTKTKGRGTGLGMATVFGVVKQNNAAISVYSEPNQGATFKIYWPITGEKITDDLSRDLENQQSYGTETILLVEDEEAVRKFALETLQELGYTVYDAVNGREALELIKEKRILPDLLLTDLIMPEMNGMELVEEVEVLFPEIGILYASGYTDNHLKHTGVLEEGIHFIHKPYSVRDLARKVREILDNW